jgi:hypothetical protein
LVVTVDYPEGAVTAPVFTPGAGVSNVTNDLGSEFTAAPIKLGGLPKPFMRATYKTCRGATAVTASDFKCRVTDASNDQGDPVRAEDVTCAVSLP